MCHFSFKYTWSLSARHSLFFLQLAIIRKGGASTFWENLATGQDSSLWKDTFFLIHVTFDKKIFGTTSNLLAFVLAQWNASVCLILWGGNMWLLWTHKYYFVCFFVWKMNVKNKPSCLMQLFGVDVSSLEKEYEHFGILRFTIGTSLHNTTVSGLATIPPKDSTRASWHTLPPLESHP